MIVLHLPLCNINTFQVTCQFQIMAWLWRQAIQCTKMVIMTRADKGLTDQETKELSENMSEQKFSRSGLKVRHSETPYLNTK